MAPRRFLFVLALVSSAAYAQWLNLPTPGIPRTSAGKPNLAAPAPRAPDGKPDLSGVWMHEITSVEEVRRLFGSRFDNAIKVNAVGMEIGTQHKYAFDILVDFKPGESPLRPEASDLMRQREANVKPAELCTDIVGIPRAGLLSRTHQDCSGAASDHGFV